MIGRRSLETVSDCGVKTALSCIGCETLDKSFLPLCLSFLTCKMGSLKACSEVWMRSCTPGAENNASC